ncbi:MAG TPA: hypothetical protein VGV06_07385 [Methylomirabilota bacterium]|nr:hypothetical protein [Methylomirabilota bacterium]
MRFPLIVLTVLCLSWSSAEADDYKYPFHDPYVATITSAILNSDALAHRPTREVVHVPGLPGRDAVPLLEGRDGLSVALYRQRHPAPLLFILSGIGSNPYFGLSTYFAGLFYRESFHVVILPSPMSWNFALAASRSGAPGYAPEDARDLYEAMQTILTLLRTQYNVEPTGINFLGASLGALEGAYLSVIDADERKIGIRKFLLMNPPLDLSYALTKADAWDAFKNKFGGDKSKSIVAKALGIVESFSREKRDDPTVFARLAKAFAGFTTEELQFLIAEDLQSLLPELVYVTQAIHDQNILKTPTDQAKKRLQEAKGLTFKDYFEKIAVPLWRLRAAEPQADSESFWKRGSLAPILGRLRGYSPVQLMHNADDFIAPRESIEELKDTLGDQVILYPYGGHLGNLWYPENKEYVLRYFRTPR